MSQPVGEYLDRLERNLSNHPAEEAKRRANAKAIGRVVMSARLRMILRNSALNLSVLTIEPNLPVLNYFAKGWMERVAATGKGSESMRLSPEAAVPRRIYDSETFLDALRYVPGLDIETAFSPVTVPFIDISAEDDPKEEWKISIAMKVGDVTTSAYDQAHVLQREKDLLLPIRYPRHRPIVANPPTHKIHIANAFSKDNAPADLENVFREGFAEAGITEGFPILFSPIQLVAEQL